MKQANTILVLSSCAILIGCTTTDTHTTQSFTVKTERASGASCALVDRHGSSWKIPSTPGTKTITKANGPLDVTCTKPGFKTTSVKARGYQNEITVWMEPMIFTSDIEREVWFKEKAAYEAK